VGGGAAGGAAAWNAAREGASVLVIEKAATTGGTTAKSAGVMWIPNNHHMRAAGIIDERMDAIRYMARCSYPLDFEADASHLGVGPQHYDLIAGFFDNGARLVETLETEGVVRFAPLDYPDYYGDVEENKAPFGRSLKIAYPSDRQHRRDRRGGAWLVQRLLEAASLRGARILANHRVQRILLNEAGEAIGLEVRSGRAVRLIAARRGVVFCSGGFLHNAVMRSDFLRGPIFGGAASRSSTGDLVPMATSVGAQLGNMAHAWWDQVVLELACGPSETIDDVYSPFGDSMLMVNRFGERVVNEKAPYNERGQIHHVWDAQRLEYPNRILAMLFDDEVLRSTAQSPFRWPVPQPGEDPDYLISGGTFGELAERINERLDRIRAFVGGVKLAENFVEVLERTVARFNDFAIRGIDLDFGRGETMIEKRWAVARRDGMPNDTMYPLAPVGPYHCILLGGGALDTKGGPVTDTFGRMLDAHDAVIPGLYGAGNCVASPAGQAYWGAGGTIGLAFTFGALAGGHAAARRSSKLV
jgi:succinate dehydrogenase/fumarate reductase flavoprotein subunit